MESILGDFELTTTGLGFDSFARCYFNNGFFTGPLIGMGSQNT